MVEANAGNAISKYYIYGQGLSAMVDVQANQLYVYHFDGAGHTVALSNQNQQTVNSYAYDPYGKLMAQKWQYLKRSPVFFSKQRKDAPIM